MQPDLFLELLENQSFTEWVKSDFEKNDDEWSAFIDQHPNDHDIINKAIKFIQHVQSESDVYKNKNQLFSRIEKTAGLEFKEAKVIQISPVRKYLSYAASLLVLVSLSLYFTGRQTIKTEIGEQLVVQLPDESKVTLNTNSTLRYHSIFWFIGRKVNLDGEAFFEVEKGKTFTVQTQNGDVQVLGTSFNVRTGNNQSLDVFCYTGRVSVQTKKELSTYILTPGEGVRSHSEKESTKYTSPETEPNWKSGRVQFNDVTLQEIILVLQNYFPYQIQLAGDVASEKITADVPLTNIDSALQNITWPLGLKYKIKEKQVTISR